MTTAAHTISLPQFADGHLLTNSAESAFRACPRRYALGYVHGLRPQHDSDPLRIGSAFHAGLEALKSGKTEDEAAGIVRSAYADAPCPPWMEVEDFKTEEETATAMVRAWGRRYASDGILRYVAVELSFDLPIPNPRTGRPHPFYRNAGKIDGIAELPDSRLALVEYKTASDDISAGSAYWKRLLMDAQVSRYWNAAHDLGYPVQTVVYDVTKKPGIAPKKLSKAERANATAKGNYFGLPLKMTCPERETPQMYGARLLADMLKRGDHYFHRAELSRLDSDLEQFRLDQWATLRDIQACQTDDYWPRNTNACTKPFNCQFLEICRGMRGNPDEQIPDGFKRAIRLHTELTPPAEPAEEAL